MTLAATNFYFCAIKSERGLEIFSLLSIDYCLFLLPKYGYRSNEQGRFY